MRANYRQDSGVNCTPSPASGYSALWTLLPVPASEAAGSGQP
jgi:hypothetical protein